MVVGKILGPTRKYTKKSATKGLMMRTDSFIFMNLLQHKSDKFYIFMYQANDGQDGLYHKPGLQSDPPGYGDEVEGVSIGREGIDNTFVILVAKFCQARNYYGKATVGYGIYPRRHLF